jgi:glutaredoxin
LFLFESLRTPQLKTSTFFLLVAVAGGTLQNRDKITDWFNPPLPILNVSGNNQVILYSTTWCGYCAKTREYFAENHIQFTDLDVEHSEKGRSDYQSLGGHGIPIVVINNEAPIHGYNPKKINEALSTASH